MSLSKARAPTSGRSDVEIGMLLMTAAMFTAPGSDAIGKLLSATLAPAEVACGRFAFQTMLLLPVVLVTRRRLARRNLGLQAARGVLLATAVLLFFWALKYLPIADAVAIFFVEPLVLTLMSALLLGERIGWRRLGAVLAGLIGALIVIRPGWAAFGWAAVLPLGTAVCLAGYLTLTRHMSAAEDPVVMQVWTGIFAGIVLALALLAGAATDVAVLAPSWPAPGAWAWLAALGALAAATHVLMALAFRRAPAGVLAPFHYLQIISATLLGYFFFGHFPDAPTILGTAIIVGAGLYVFRRERRRAARPAPATDRP